MPDPAEQLQALYAAGFELKTFDRFPRAIGVLRGSCIVLLQQSGTRGLEMIGRPGWQIGEVIGVLTEKDGRKVFQAKSETVEATDDRRAQLTQFEKDLNEILESTRYKVQ
jgi:hypothetical protein